MTDLPAPQTKKPATLVADLWRWQGTMSRRRYVAWGTSLFTVKYGIDFSVAYLIFHRSWFPWNYFIPGQSLDFLAMSPEDRQFFATLVTLSLPFIWIGIVMTMRRLRDTGQSVFWSKLFFVPFVNLLMFTMLSFLPGRHDDELLPTLQEQRDAVIQSDKRELQKAQSAAPLALSMSGKGIDSTFAVGKPKGDWLPDFAFAIATTVPFAMAFSWLGMFTLQEYGWGLFVGIPFALGLSSSFLFGRNQVRSWRACSGVTFAAMCILGIGIFATAWEGVGCLMMAAPIAFALAFLGAYLGYDMQKLQGANKLERNYPVMSLLIALPVFMTGEKAATVGAPVMPVVSTMVVAAPPSEVWKNVIAFPRLKSPTELIFKTGIAYPIGATISGTGLGAVRHCKFSTGEFVEPITEWQPPSKLGFNVISQPATMRETTWAREIQAAHLHGYLNVKHGQFQLVPIKVKGKVCTEIVGTTWYQNNMWPNLYWRLWSDHIIHQIHLRVLNHIKEQTELHMVRDSHQRDTSGT